MPKLRFSEITEADIRSVEKIGEKDFDPDRWKRMSCECTDREEERIRFIQEYLSDYKLSLMNEATIWARAIYPLLMVAESGNIQAWSQISLHAAYPHFELEGIADGILGRCASGKISVPYLVVVEVRRGLEAEDPQFQLYAQMLAAAWVNQQYTQKPEQEIFGCYTISDTWTFVHVIVSDFDGEYPGMDIDTSKEYIQRFEAKTIFQMIKSVIATYSAGIDD